MEVTLEQGQRDAVPTCEPCQLRHASSGSLAVKFCKNCKEHLCITCAGVHQSSKATRTHLVINVDDIGFDTVIEQDFERLQKCHFHPEKELEYFSFESGHFCCSTCIITQSLQAKDICDINAAGEKLIVERYTDTIFAELDSVIEICKTEETNINKVKQGYFINRENIKQQLHQIRMKILTILDEYETQILYHVENNVQTMLSVINPQLQMVVDTRKTFEKNKQIYDSVVNNGSRGDIFRCSFSVTRQLDELKVRKAAKYSTPVTELRLSPALFSFVNNILPALWCDTYLTDRESNCFQPLNIGMAAFIKTISQTDEHRNEELGEDGMTKADCEYTIINNDNSDSVNAI